MGRGKSAKSGEIREFIIDHVDEHPYDLTRIVSQNFEISRQAAHQHIGEAVKDGIITAGGSGRARYYETRPLVDLIYQFDLSPQLQEDLIWREHVRPALGHLLDNVLQICEYGFTEMFNNAIDHSEGTQTTIRIYCTAKGIRLDIMDNGVGIFRKIQRALNLADARQALLELGKGKFTTDPDRHSGQGIFFTSRAFDHFIILSHDLSFVHGGSAKQDWLLSDLEEGETDASGQTVSTHIMMTIDARSKRDLTAVFDEYASADVGDYGFTKTKVPVELARLGDENFVSRSQAKRLLARLDRFRDVILDFNKIDSIGQAFADEIFRVYRIQHPEVNILPINANEDVMRMIFRAMRPDTASQGS